ncbi:iron-containing alcohol dehydrogenase [Bordetella parapertussis]|uniref:Iron-containing alcohol dehydrogenase n=2 Tax=Bordetella parapertussis TaxID=519 RepID=Q7WBY2_BORPA|nr:iron-containing alcohol dehydrogenase [Bordetella parapertussis]AOB37884.1 alcohol dehydrogenase [Bordetella parapertussis]AUL41854.1 alcohol dehydrogenase [Bordetella parapertussis]AWP61767.1 alcohol dehydrogenase [Bordetella parapertussis]AWP69265.1 alcohol dehydrogenase [Bordetella parapertussis]AWP87857.1 alcohol dehydrogenase [Bordetella parapertussis]
MIHTGKIDSPRIGSVLFGPGALQRLGQCVPQLHARRVLLVTTTSLARQPDVLDEVRGALGGASVAIYGGARQHVPWEQVVEGARAARQHEADLLVSLGGSSATDVTKGINLALAEAGAEGCAPFLARHAALGADAAKRRFSRPKLMHVAIPTTLSGAEFSSSVGMTDARTRRKFAMVDAALTPGLIVLDPAATRQTSAALWTSTALKVLADCFEEICSPRHVPMVDALALQSVRIIDRYLLASAAAPMDQQARAMLQHATWMCESVKACTGLGIVTALRHQIGGMFDVPHGMASSVVFPAGVRFNRPGVDERLALIADAMGLQARDTAAAAGAALQRAQELIAAASLPTRLRDVGVPRDGLDRLAEAVMLDRQTLNNPRPVESVAQVRELLGQIW